MFALLAPRLAQGAAWGVRYALQGALLHGAVVIVMWLLGFGPSLSSAFILGGA